MARTGLTKSQVRAARDRLLGAGRHPSVDAVRHALGDSGSKSTIHKYLKELQAEEGAGTPGLRRTDTGHALQALVDQLAERLHADAEERLCGLRAEYEARLAARERELADLRAANTQLAERVRALETAAPEDTGADPAPPWPDRQRAPVPGGFGRFDGALFNSRAAVRACSPFDLIRAAARS